jgi:hypothetical protein
MPSLAYIAFAATDRACPFAIIGADAQISATVAVDVPPSIAFWAGEIVAVFVGV